MKIRVTLEKADILRLVKAHLHKSGLNPVADQDIKYKGALQVELLVDVEDTVHVQDASSEPPAPTGKDAPAKVEPEQDGQTMEEVLAESERIKREVKAPVRRQLGVNESYEYPRGEK